MKFKKMLGITALAALLAIPAGVIHKAPNIHASVRQTSLPYSYRGTWGTSRAYDSIGRSWKERIATKFYKNSGYFENISWKHDPVNGLQHFAKPRYLHGTYASLPASYRGSNYRKMRAGIRFRLSRNHRTMDYFVGSEKWYMHRISNRSYQSAVRSIQNYKKRNRKYTKRHSLIRIRRSHQAKRNNHKGGLIIFGNNTNNNSNNNKPSTNNVANTNNKPSNNASIVNFGNIDTNNNEPSSTDNNIAGNDSYNNTSTTPSNTTSNTPSNSVDNNASDNTTPASNTPYQHVNLTEMAKREVYDINQDREARGISPVSISNPLSSIAQKRASQANKVYSHYYPNSDVAYDNSDARQMGLSHSEHGIEDWGNAENLNEAYPSEGNADQIADAMNNDFMYHDADSDWGHRRNILNPSYRYVGTGTDYSTHSDDGVPYKLAEDFSTNLYF